jgi:biopolymer transport protein ExbD
MKFPRNARIFRTHLDAAPFVTVFFLVAAFLIIGELLYTPGLQVQLPVADDLPGTDKPSVSVALDKNGSFYYDSKWMTEQELKRRLPAAAASSIRPPVLIIHADQEVSCNMLVHLSLIAREAGLKEAMLATLPRPTQSGK